MSKISSVVRMNLNAGIGPGRRDPAFGVVDCDDRLQRCEGRRPAEKPRARESHWLKAGARFDWHLRAVVRLLGCGAYATDWQTRGFTGRGVEGDSPFTSW